MFFLFILSWFSSPLPLFTVQPLLPSFPLQTVYGLFFFFITFLHIFFFSFTKPSFRKFPTLSPSLSFTRCLYPSSLSEFLFNRYHIFLSLLFKSIIEYANHDLILFPPQKIYIQSLLYHYSQYMPSDLFGCYTTIIFGSPFEVSHNVVCCLHSPNRAKKDEFIFLSLALIFFYRKGLIGTF